MIDHQKPRYMPDFSVLKVEEGDFCGKLPTVMLASLDDVYVPYHIKEASGYAENGGSKVFMPNPTRLRDPFWGHYQSRLCEPYASIIDHQALMTVPDVSS